MQRRTAKRLLDALNAAQRAVRFVRNHSFEDFLEDEILRAGVERQLLTIGEALNAARREDARLRATYLHSTNGWGCGIESSMSRTMLITTSFGMWCSQRYQS